MYSEESSTAQGIDRKLDHVSVFVVGLESCMIGTDLKSRTVSLCYTALRKKSD